MSRQRLNEWWCHRGSAWSALGDVTRELLNALRVYPDNSDIGRRIRDALAAAEAAQLFIGMATEQAEQEARGLAARRPTSEGGRRMSVIACAGVASVPDRFDCGVDFCQACGDCLACYGGDGCSERNWQEHTYAPTEPEPSAFTPVKPSDPKENP